LFEFEIFPLFATFVLVIAREGREIIVDLVADNVFRSEFFTPVETIRKIVVGARFVIHTISASRDIDVFDESISANQGECE
jgi:hypothetical protein